MSAQRVDSLRLVWLQAFLAVAEWQSHTVAAEKLGWDQSTVSRYIMRLENWLGRTVLTKAVPPALTKHGKAFLPIARQVMDLLASSRRPKAANRKRPISPALAKESAIKVLKLTTKYGPILGRPNARKAGMTDELLQQAQQELNVLQTGRRVGSSTAHIDMSSLNEPDGSAEAGTDTDGD